MKVFRFLDVCSLILFIQGLVKLKKSVRTALETTARVNFKSSNSTSTRKKDEEDDYFIYVYSYCTIFFFVANRLWLFRWSMFHII